MARSTSIYSERVLQVIQKVFDNRKIFTVWDKTEMFVGHYIVYYFNENIQHFGSSIDAIDQILFEEISSVEITSRNCNLKSKAFLQELNQFIRDNQKQQEEIAILYFSGLQLKLNLFGNKSYVKPLKTQIQQMIQKHQLKTCFLNINETQVRALDYILDFITRY